MTLRRLVNRMMTVSLGLVMAVGLVSATTGVASAQQGGGTGPYPAEYTTQWDLGDHTIYRPQTLPDEPMPVVVWGNGACSADGTWFENFLTEIASHGFLVIANGEPDGSGSTSADMLTEGIDWAVDENDQFWSEYNGQLDTDNIAVMGQSCGGIEAYEASADDRVTTTVLWNSGLLSPFDQNLLDDLHAPTAYFTGGEDDIAHGNAQDDWDDIPSDLPAFFASLDVGHYGTFEEPNGGEYGQVGAEWLKWQLKGDTTARSEFVGYNCGLCNSEWENVDQRNLG